MILSLCITPSTVPLWTKVFVAQKMVALICSTPNGDGNPNFATCQGNYVVPECSCVFDEPCFVSSQEEKVEEDCRRAIQLNSNSITEMKNLRTQLYSTADISFLPIRSSDAPLKCAQPLFVRHLPLQTSRLCSANFVVLHFLAVFVDYRRARDTLVEDR